MRKPPAQRAGRTVDWGAGGKGAAEAFRIPLSGLGALQAIEAGWCSRCETRFPAGSWIFRGEQDQVIGVNCCATPDDVRGNEGDPAPLGGPGYGTLEDAEDAEGRDFVPLAQVMPAGRTKADMCTKCFQIPSASGACGC